MGTALVKIKLMPKSPETDLEEIKQHAESIIKKHNGSPARTEEEPIAFGLRALKIIFIMDEAKGSTQPLEDELSKIKGVMNVDVMEVRRALG